jgi:hypothetical protein
LHNELGDYLTACYYNLFYCRSVESAIAFAILC